MSNTLRLVTNLFHHRTGTTLRLVILISPKERAPLCAEVSLTHREVYPGCTGVSHTQGGIPRVYRVYLSHGGIPRVYRVYLSHGGIPRVYRVYILPKVVYPGCTGCVYPS